MRGAIFTVMKKELLRFFSDKRMVLTTLILPGLMIYVLYNFMGSALTDQFSVDDTYAYSISAVNLPDSVKELAKTADLKIKEISGDKTEKVKTAIVESKQDLLLIFPKNFDSIVAEYDAAAGKAAPNVEIYYNSTKIESGGANEMVTALLNGYESAMTNKFDINNTESTYDLAKEEDTTAMIFASMLPLLLLIFMFSGCMAVAPESIAGEKERGTIAALLITPAKRGHIAAGKIFALSVIAMLSGMSSATGTILSLPKLMGMAADEMNASVYGVTEYALLGVIVLSTVLVMITVISIVSCFAKTVKEAQAYVTPLMIVIMLIGVTAMFGDGAQTQWYYYLIPAYNSVQCMVGIFRLSVDTANILTAVAANLAFTGVGVFVLTKMFNSEKIMFSR